MSKVLIVDDELDYRDQLETILSWQGHETRSVASGREAIDVGARYRPDVLVVDWMLKNHIHGLHVSETLRTVVPHLQTIMITGFASRDLRNEADNHRIFDFVEKPFDLKYIQSAVEKAGRQAPEEIMCAVAVLELDASGRIIYANKKARRMFAQTLAGQEATWFKDLFSVDGMPDLDAAAVWWVLVKPLAEQPVSWRVRSQTPRQGGTRLVVLMPTDGPQYLQQKVVSLLLEVEEPRTICWPFESRVLVVDDQELFRRFAVAMLQAAGAGCYSAETRAHALRLFGEDEGINYVILDFEMPDGGLEEFVAQLRRIRPEVCIIGTSGEASQEAFEKMGVNLFLAKPWRLSDLIQLLSDERSP